MRSDNRKIKSRGFGLVEMLLVIVILGILAGMTFVGIGRSTDSTEAAAIMAHLDSAKSALLAYSMEHKTRNVDPLNSFVGQASSSIRTSIDKYLESNVQTGGNASAVKYFSTLSVRLNNGNQEVGFSGFAVSPGIASALNKKISASGGMYTGSGGSGTYSMWLPIR